MSCVEERQWPSMAIFLTMNVKNRKRQFYYSWESDFLRSYRLFWPHQESQITTIIAVDAEKNSTSEYHEVKRTLNSHRVQLPSLKFISVPPSTEYLHSFYSFAGYSRQMWYMFWIDNFTENHVEYVGFVDHDTVFTTYVSIYDLFAEQSRPVVNARHGIKASNSEPAAWDASTYKILGIKQPFNCMSYFPVIMKIQHIRAMREFITNLHNRSTFNEAFTKDINPLQYRYHSLSCPSLFLL